MGGWGAECGDRPSEKQAGRAVGVGITAGECASGVRLLLAEAKLLAWVKAQHPGLQRRAVSGGATRGVGSRPRPLQLRPAVAGGRGAQGERAWVTSEATHPAGHPICPALNPELSRPHTTPPPRTSSPLMRRNKRRHSQHRRRCILQQPVISGALAGARGGVHVSKMVGQGCRRGQEAHCAGTGIDPLLLPAVRASPTSK